MVYYSIALQMEGEYVTISSICPMAMMTTLNIGLFVTNNLMKFINFVCWELSDCMLSLL